jgi:hypothetical protein
MLTAAYIMEPTAVALCDRDGCADVAHFTVICMNGAIVEHLCPDHAAQHMRGNAYALDGGDSIVDAVEAAIFQELDDLPVSEPED